MTGPRADQAETLRLARLIAIIIHSEMVSRANWLQKGTTKLSSNARAEAPATPHPRARVGAICSALGHRARASGTGLAARAVDRRS